MSEIKEKGLGGSDILPTDVTSTDGSITSPSSHQDANIEVPLRSWEKPGFKGSVRRFLRSVQGYIWDDPDKPAIEKRFLLKLDFFLLTYGCLGYFCKNLDQANLNNAYVSGMQEAINMKGSQLTYMGNVFTAGYVISQIPAVILVTHVRPSILIPTLEVLWSIFTFCSAAVTNVSQLYALRFLIGLCEGAFFPCIIYVIGSWYTKQERAKRVTLFYCTATLATMFSGYLQAAAYDNLSGHLGHAGWQWLFIICGTISLPVGVIGYFFNPDFPETTRAFYLTKAEITLAKERLVRDGYNTLGSSAWDKKKLFRMMAQWQFWVLPFGYFFIQASLPSQQPAFALWLKAKGNSVYDRDVLPTAQAGIGVIVQVVAAMISDSNLLHGKRWPPIIVMQLGTLFSAIVLAIWTVPIKLKFVAFYLAYFSAGVPGIWFSWYPDLMSHDHEMRGFLIATSNMFGYIMQIWYSDAVWRTEEAPEFRPGWVAAATFGAATALTALLTRFLERRDERKGTGAFADRPNDLENSRGGGSIETSQ
ncbi:putative pantothenate transporter liz1 protein [Botrytis fragariae]|uniref:Putative pantothenate transporter liz1 protein n=1 Tax=Botrytis fragariae TaxID=1964551 RepID=A0A8H6AIS2_9HELO|nr:putative pantothenate transporter liz1 protein [Botrytis fragariae]KAF5868152.1 putative pantothenate transporter liz1 protein [Botrytis fragariae]